MPTSLRAHIISMSCISLKTEEIEPTEADDTALIVYTNTNPKGAELTHSQLYNSCTDAGELFGLRDEDIRGQRNGCGRLLKAVVDSVRGSVRTGGRK
jgi:hypothetical protein